MRDNGITILLTIIVVVLMLVCVITTVIDNTEKLYTLEQTTVAQGDTFWSYYNEGYYSGMSYSEALYTFKKDNGMDKYDLIAGESIVLRKKVK